MGALHMSNRVGGEIMFSSDFCTATVPIAWYPLNSTDVVTGTATINSPPI